MKDLLSAVGVMVAGMLLSMPTALSAQSAASPYTSGTRYDEAGRVVGTIAPDPDGAGSLNFLATRTTIDARGLVTKVETGELNTWKSEAVLPEDWGPDFTVHTTSETEYDVNRRKVVDRVRGSDGLVVSLIQYSYDNRGRLECTAVRMNPAAYGSLPPDACTLGEMGANGPDRITQTIYDAAGQVLQIRKAVGATHGVNSIEIADVTYTYTPNGKIAQVIDANGNRAELRYDGHDRQIEWVFPSKVRPTSFDDSDPTTALATAGALSTDDGDPATDDVEKYEYDDNGNRTQLTKRDGSVITYQYDALNRMILKDIPDTRVELQDSATHRRDVYYGYDLRGLQTYARFDSPTGVGVTYQYDGFGRIISESQNSDGNSRAISSQYDANGNRTRMTYADGGYIDYTYDGLNRFSTASWWHSTSGGLVPFANTTFNQRGLLEGLGVSGSTTDFSYDPVGRMQSLAFDFTGTSGDVTWSYTRNPASQILSESQTNDDYTWDGHVDVTRNYVTNGLNQYDSAGSASFCYDDNGNLTADGTSVYLYDYENRLVQRRAQTNSDCEALSYAGALDAELHYDPTGRLYQINGGTYRFLYDGNALVAEYNSAGTMLRRYAHATNVEADDPLALWEGSDMTCTGARFMHADPRGSIVALADCNGARQVVNAYDEYGIPDSATGDDISTKGRFRYTGQVWIPELGMYYYKARIYSPTLGRFLQTDPIGYEDQFNLYAYVGNDPVNASDPTGKRGRATRATPGAVALQLCARNGWTALACASGVALVATAATTVSRQAAIVNRPRLQSTPRPIDRRDERSQSRPATAEATNESDNRLVFHRKGVTPEAYAEILATGLLKGRTPRNNGHRPTVQAYYGPLPNGEQGFTFTTPVPPQPGQYIPPRPGDRTDMIEARWYQGSPGVLTSELDGEEVAAIPIDIVP